MKTTPQGPKPLLVAVVGGSGAGKSWLAERLCRRLAPHAARLSLDDFYRDRSQVPPARRARLNFDHPRSIDWPALDRVLADLAAGRATECPAYDFATHCRRAVGKTVQPKQVIIVEGLWLLWRPALRRMWDMSIFVDCPKRTRLQRRLRRDMASRGRTAMSVRAQFRSTVEPMHKKFVAPQARWAEEILSGECGEPEVERLAVRVKQRAR